MNNVYIEIVKKSYKQKLVYKTNTLLNILGSVIKLVIQVSLWMALFKSRENVDGVTFYDMFNYIIINTIILSIVQSNIGNALAQKIKDGSIALDLIKPINIKYLLFADDFGGNVFRTVFCILPICLISSIIFRFQLPSNFLALIIFFISVINGIIIMYNINYIIGMVAFWMKTTWYIQWYLNALFTLFGGTFIPIWFYPTILYKISSFLPFYFVSFAPISIYNGKLSLNSSIIVLLFQFVWIFGLLKIEKFIWNRAQRKITVQGG